MANPNRQRKLTLAPTKSTILLKWIVEELDWKKISESLDKSITSAFRIKKQIADLHETERQPRRHPAITPRRTGAAQRGTSLYRRGGLDSGSRWRWRSARTRCSPTRSSPGCRGSSRRRSG